MAQEFDTGLISVTGNFLKNLKISFTKTYLEKRLKQNPYYPSLFSVNQVLNEYNILNKGLQIEVEELEYLSLPFLAYIEQEEIGSKDFVNVTNVNDNLVTYFDGKNHTISKEKFIEKWSSRVVLLVEPNSQSVEKNFKENKKRELGLFIRKSLLAVGLLLFLCILTYNYLHPSTTLLSSTIILTNTLLGLTTSILILIYEIDRSNAFVKNICTGGNKANCAAVLDSKAAKILGISWGEIGFFYFGFLLFFLYNPSMSFFEKVSYLSLFSVITAAYIPFSIIYQYIVVKQWCRLCLAVQSVLFLNLIWTIKFGNFDLIFEGIHCLHLSGSLIFPVVIWYLLKPIIMNAKDAERFLNAYKRLSTRPDVFALLMQDQKKILEGWQMLRGIEKGNRNAENIIFKVCSPACGHCNRAHSILNEIIYSNDNVKVITIYLITNNEDDERRFPVRHFLALNELGDKKALEEAMDYWYLTKNREYSILKQRYPVDEELLMKQNFTIDAMKEWCDAAEVSYTPAIFINGRYLPSTFDLVGLNDYF